jgi:hypothetical protein
VPATLPHHLRWHSLHDSLHAPPPLAEPHHPLQPRTQPPQFTARNIISAFAGVRNHPLTSQLAADARSVPLRSSDVSCVIRKRLGASDAAPSSPIKLPARTAALRLAPRKPHHPLQPRAQPPQPTARNIIPALPAFASIRAQPSCCRCTQRTSEVQRRQLRHPSETRSQRHCPIVSDPIACTQRRPSARPSQAPPPAPAPCPTAPAHSTQHHHHIADVRKHPLTAQPPKMHAAYN